MSYLVGVDTGGTFTDFVLFDPETQELAVYKFPSTPEDPSRALFEGLKELLNHKDAGSDQITALMHGTTVATNAVLQDQLPDIGLITTSGFRDVKVRAILRRLFPEALVSFSSEVLREFREYERFSMTAINAALLPSLNSISGVD